KYAHERRTFGDEIGRHQLVKQMISRMAAGIEAGRLLVGRAGWLKNRGRRNTRETSLAKWHATEHAVASALDAIQIHGANGYSNEFPVERYLRNSKAAVIYEGTSQLHTLIQADYALGYREDRPLRCEPLPPAGCGRLPAAAAAAAGRAEEAGVGGRQDRLHRDRRRSESRRLADDDGLDERERAAGERLQPGGGQRAGRQAGAACRVDRADRPADVGEEQDEDPAGVERR